MQEISLDQLKLKVNDSYRKNEKITTNSELHKNEDVVNKSYLDAEIPKIEDRLTKKGKD